MQVSRLGEVVGIFRGVHGTAEGSASHDREFGRVAAESVDHARSFVLDEEASGRVVAIQV